MEVEKGNTYAANRREQEKRKNGRRGCRMAEAVCLTLVVFAVCANFAIPAIIYYIRPTASETDSTNSSEVSVVCVESAVYTGATCRAELQMYQECFSASTDSNGDVLVRSDINQETVEADAQLLIEGGLSFLNSSDECVAAIRPFLCLFLFGVCDSSSQLRQVSSSECVELRDDICATEWSAALDFLGPGTLPVCEELLGQTQNCMNDSSLSFNNSVPPIDTIALNGNSGLVRECRDDFYLNNESLCLPVCGNYTEDGMITAVRVTVFTILSCCIAIVSAILVIILSFTVQRKFMLTFPSYFLLYLCLTTVIEAILILIGYTDRKALFCNNIDLMDSISNPTPYCQITGIMYYYTVMQTALWVSFHMAALFWGIAFPFHYREFKENGYIKYIHITAVLVAVLVPLVPALAPLKDGYIPVRYPPVVCSAASADYTFYTLVLPISVLLAISTCLLILTFWIILKEFVIKKISRGQKASSVGKAEVKILFVFCYYIILGGLALGIFTYYSGVNDRLIAEFQNFFLCESLGVHSGRDCNALLSSSSNFSSLYLVGIVMHGLISFVVLLFVVNFKHCQCKNQEKVISTSRVKVESRNLSAANPNDL